MPPKVHCQRRKSPKTCTKPDTKGRQGCEWDDAHNKCVKRSTTPPSFSEKPPSATTSPADDSSFLAVATDLCATNENGNHKRNVKNSLMNLAIQLKRAAPAEARRMTVAKLCACILAKKGSFRPVVTEKEANQVLSRLSRMTPRKTGTTNTGASQAVSALYPIDNRVAYAHQVAKAVERAKQLKKGCDIISTVKGAAPFWAVKRIGSKSVNGEAHLVVANSGFDARSPSLMFVLKIAPNKIPNEDNTVDFEYDMCRRFGKFVTSNMCPHFPLSYDLIVCEKPCTYTNADMVRRGPTRECKYMLNELATGDLQSWVLDNFNTITPDQLCSMYMQVILAVGVMHMQGYTHGDLHWGNVLYHNMPEHTIGKYWKYVVYGKTIYILNTGQLWVLWDFGRVVKYTASIPQDEEKEDLERLFYIPMWVPQAALSERQIPNARIRNDTNMASIDVRTQLYMACMKRRQKYTSGIDLLLNGMKRLSSNYRFFKYNVRDSSQVINETNPFVIEKMTDL